MQNSGLPLYSDPLERTDLALWRAQVDLLASRGGVRRLFHKLPALGRDLLPLQELAQKLCDQPRSAVSQYFVQ